MKTRWPGCLILVSALLAGCSGASAGGGPTPPASNSASKRQLPDRQPPLRLPSIAPGEPCPVASVSHHAEVVAHSRDVLGDGRLGPVSNYFDAGAKLRLRAEDRDESGAYTKKVRWIAFDYAGPVLIRAARIDGGPGKARVEFSYTGRRTADGFSAEAEAGGGWQDFPAVTHLDGPGCYAYQVDTAGSSQTIVFSAARG